MPYSLLELGDKVLAVLVNETGQLSGFPRLSVLHPLA